MANPLEELMAGLGDPSGIFGGIVDSMKNIAMARPITLKEPDDVVEAIQMHEERVRLLKVIQEKGFTTIAEYNKYKQAEELIAEHKQKMEADEAASD